MKKTGLFLVIALFWISCTHNREQKTLVTVNGEIPPEEMGVALIHEHVMVDWIGADSTGYNRWDKSEVVDRAIPFLQQAKEYGVQTFFSCTPAYIGRDPIMLKKLSERTGVNIVTNTGYYGAVGNKFIPQHAFEDEAEEIAKIWINEFTGGIEGSNIFPGFIKIAVAKEDSLSPLHTKLVKAAAITHKATGLTIVSHTGPDEPAFAQLEILKNEGISPEAFVWTHAQHGTLKGWKKAASQGAWISLDHVKRQASGNPKKPGRIEWYVKQLAQLKQEGFLDQILISHDSGWYTVGEKNGGDYRGYTCIFEYLIPALKKNGFTRKDIELLLVKNPQKAYAVNKRLHEKK
jgi:phosphotriesterase-related protein